jgi:hypothetical protein
MSTHRDKQPKNLHAYMGQGLERALEELDLTEEYVALRFFGFELRRVRRITHSRRWRWSRWLSLFGVFAALAAGVIKLWLLK